MNRIHERATVHESTIQQVAKDALPPVFQPPTDIDYGQHKQRRQPTHGAPADVHELAWAEIRRIIDGPHGYTAYERISDIEVIVR